MPARKPPLCHWQTGEPMPEREPPPSYTPQQPSQPAQAQQAVRSSPTPLHPGEPSQAAQAVQPVDAIEFDWVDVADCALNHQFALPKNTLEDLALDFRINFLNK